MKVGVFFASSIYLRSWKESGILDDLQGLVNLSVFYSADDDFLEHELKAFHPRPIHLQANLIHTITSFSSWLGHLGLSSSFGARLERVLLGNQLWWPRTEPLRVRFLSLIRGLAHLLRTLVTKPHYLALLLPPIRNLLRNFEKNSYRRLSLDLSRQFHGSLDWLIIPNLAYDPLLNPMITGLKSMGIQVALILDNWDNLSSKLIFHSKPDLLNLMGPSSRDLGRSIHSLSDESMVELGLPRFEMHRLLRSSLPIRREELSVPPRVLYVGFSSPWLEHVAVNSVLEILQGIYGPKQIATFLYRPHPARVIADYGVLSSSVRKNSVDEQARVLWGGLPRLDSSYFEQLVESEVVIGPPTTMILEAMILGIPTIVDLRDDGIFRTSPGRIVNRYEHMSQLAKLESICVVRSELELENALIEVSRGKVKMPSQRELEQLVHFGSDSFAGELTTAMRSRLRKP